MRRALVIIGVLVAIIAVAIFLVWPRHDARFANDPTSMLGKKSAAPAPAKRVRRITPELRRDVASQIAAAPTLGSAMDTPDRVLATLVPVMRDVEGELAACGSGASIHARMQLTGDSDVGTLIDTAALTGSDGAPVPKQLDDCLRGVLVDLELPPMAIGEHYNVDFDFDL